MEPTREHNAQRLRFDRNYQRWSVEYWKKVLFTEEARVDFKSPGEIRFDNC